MPPAARINDKVLQLAPHCHATVHPPAIPPTAVPHPSLPMMIIKGAPTVTIGKMPAARLGDMTEPCKTAGCPPAGPGIINQGSATVTICKQPAARLGDATAHAACVAPIPSPTGKIISGCPTVMIGG